MTIITSNVTGGSNNHVSTAEESNRLATNFISPGVVGAITNTSGVAPMTGAFGVNQAGTPNKTSIVTLGDAWNQATPSGQASQVLGIRMNANYPITHSDNTSGSTRYDWIYLVTDATKANNPAVDASDVTSIVVNRSTSSASDTIGAPAYSQPIAMVTLANGFVSITNANITDKRTAAGAPIPDASVTTLKLGASAVNSSKVDWSVATGKVWWEELGRTTLSSTSINISLTPITSRKYLRIHIFIPTAGGDFDPGIRFNNDSNAANYLISESNNNGAVSNGTASLGYLGVGATTRSLWAEIDVCNVSTERKMINGKSTSFLNGSTTPQMKDFHHAWNNTASGITRVDFINLSGTSVLPAGSELVVLGHD